MLPWVCSVIDHGGRQNVVKKMSDTRATGECTTSLFSHFEVVRNLLLNRRTATWNLFVN